MGQGRRRGGIPAASGTADRPTVEAVAHASPREAARTMTPLETNDYLALMDFNVGDQVTMGPGLSDGHHPALARGRGNPPRHRRRLPTECQWSAAGGDAQRKRGVPPGPNALHRFEETTDGTIWARDSNESTGSASIRKRLPFRSGNFWNSQASNRMFRCRTRPSTTRTRRPADRTIRT